MKFNLTIDSGGNDAEVDLTEILPDVARRCEAGQLSGPIMDYNGNTIGRYELRVTSADRRRLAWRMRDVGKDVPDIARELGVTQATVYRYLNG